MKIIRIIGSSAQKVLLPLLQYPERFDSAVFIVQKSEQEAYSYIKSFLDEKGTEPAVNSDTAKFQR